MVNEQITLQKFKKQSHEMGVLRFAQMGEIFPFQGYYDNTDKDKVRIDIPNENFDVVIEKNHMFGGPDTYLWLKKTVDIPPAKEGYIPYGYFDFGRGGTNEGFEALVYVNGEPFQGMGENHREVNFTNFAGQTIELTFMLWSGMNARHELDPVHHQHWIARAEIGYLDVVCDELYYYCRGLSEALEFMDKNLPEYYVCVDATEKALANINWDKEEYKNSAVKALEALRTELSKHPKTSGITVHCVGHTHIDVAWLWRLKHTREKEIRSFMSVIRQMEEFDEYKFIQTQPQLYKYLKEDRPDIYEQVKELIAKGTWEADGAMWVEADCNVSSGEALARQLMYGIKFFEEEFGKKSRYLWLPDVFGYSWALPQILKLCELDTFMTTKISWNQYNTIPNDLFKWRGIDGSEILTYFIDTPDEEAEIDARYATYNGYLNPRAVIGSWKRFKNKELSNDVLVSFGYGDGGGGPTLDMQKLRRVMDDIPGLPNVKQTPAGEFFDIIHERVDNSEREISVWDGELYLEFHRGTYTSQAKTKKWNRVLENELAKTEWLAVISGETEPVKDINDAWEVLMRNQFHDIIPGSSITEVYDDAMEEYAGAYKSIKAVQQSAIKNLSEDSSDIYTVFGFNNFKRENIVSIPEQRDGAFYQAGKQLEAQKNADGYDVQAEINGFELAQIEFKAEEVVSSAPFSFADNLLETPYYKVEFDSNGFIKSLFDKEFDKEVVYPDGRLNALEIYEDKPLKYENWDIDFYHTQKCEIFERVSEPELTENGNLYAVIKTDYEYGKSKMTQYLKVYKNNRRIDITTNIDWQESYKLFKASFDLNLRSNKASYDIQYGFVERPTHFNTSWDMARFEVVGHKWADISERNYGVSILNDSKYGHSAKDSTLKLTLLKSTKDPDPEADIGLHEFTYSILPHEHVVASSETIQQAHMLNDKENVVSGRLNESAPIIEVDSDAIVVDAIKPAEDGNGIVIRMHEARGGSACVKLKTSLNKDKIEECNIIENSLGVKHDLSSNINFKPFEIKSFRIV